MLIQWIHTAQHFTTEFYLLLLFWIKATMWVYKTTKAPYGSTHTSLEQWHCFNICKRNRYTTEQRSQPTTWLFKNSTHPRQLRNLLNALEDLTVVKNISRSQPEAVKSSFAVRGQNTWNIGVLKSPLPNFINKIKSRKRDYKDYDHLEAITRQLLIM